MIIRYLYLDEGLQSTSNTAFFFFFFFWRWRYTVHSEDITHWKMDVSGIPVVLSVYFLPIYSFVFISYTLVILVRFPKISPLSTD